jgi:hypothetical protein
VVRPHFLRIPNRLSNRHFFFFLLLDKGREVYLGTAFLKGVTIFSLANMFSFILESIFESNIFASEI